MSKVVQQKVSFAAIAAVVLFFPCARAWASSISLLQLSPNLAFEQTSNSTITLSGTFFAMDLDTTVASPYTSVSVAYPGPGTPQALSALTSTDYHYQTALLADEATMNTDYPDGTYTFTGNYSGGPDTGTVDYTGPDFPLTNPIVTDYSSLQGMNAEAAFTFTLNPFETGAMATQSYIFLTITDLTTGTVVFSDGFLPSTTTSITVPGGTLTPGDSFDYEVIYDNRDAPTSTGSEFGALVLSDTRTDGTFTAAAVSSVPEPGSAVLLGAGLLGFLLVRRRGAA